VYVIDGGFEVLQDTVPNKAATNDTSPAVEIRVVIVIVNLLVARGFPCRNSRNEDV
jgi:hypothetical protein